MVFHSTKSLNLVNSNPGTYLLRQRQKVIHFMLIKKKYKELYAFHSDS